MDIYEEAEKFKAENKKYFDDLPEETGRLLREIVTALKESGQIRGDFDPATVELSQVIAMPNPHEFGIRISNVVEGPGHYDGWTKAEVPAGRVMCHYDSITFLAGETDTLTFERDRPDHIKLIDKKLHAKS